ncbi:MAG: hypothetical protein HC872_06095 [Gammaproteobacteria bacterium]|nr:hypothetical protein [Gammaproteobacteria bacterium]
MKSVAPIASLLALLLACSATQATECVGLIENLKQESREQSGWRAMLSQLLDGQHCSSARTVLDKYRNRKVVAGRKLEDDKPLDVAAAQANLDQALADPAISDLFAKARAATSDEIALTLYQATILDAEGYYLARDLLVRRLSEKGKD